VVTPDTLIETVNQATLALLGYKEGELIGKPIATIFAEEVTLFKGTEMKKLLKEGSIRNYETNYKTKSGEKVPIRFFGSVMKDKDENLIGIVGIAHDMREIMSFIQKEKAAATAAAEAAATAAEAEAATAAAKVRAEESLAAKAYTENIVANIPSSILVFNDKLKCASANWTYYNTFKKNPSHIEGNDVTHALPSGIVTKFQIDEKVKQVLKTGKLIEITKCQCNDEIYNIKIVKIVREKASSLSSFIMVIIDDVTEKAKAEETLEKANKEILSLTKARTEFINRAAHDLRTPIIPILALTPIIKKHVKDKEILYDVQIIERNATYLKRIADSLISYLKSQTGQYNYIFKKIKTGKLIESVLITYRETFKQRKISVKNKVPKNLPLVELDELRIMEVIQNLVSNALKFMPKGGWLIITVKKIDSFINFEFKDTGIGIIKKSLPKIFDGFYKADESRHLEGVGLGLSICKEIIENHGGRIWAESKGRGKGSTLSFDIPIKQK
jgi:PAS domain S-box-containing protein